MEIHNNEQFGGIDSGLGANGEGVEGVSEDALAHVVSNLEKAKDAYSLIQGAHAQDLRLAQFLYILFSSFNQQQSSPLEGLSLFKDPHHNNIIYIKEFASFFLPFYQEEYDNLNLVELFENIDPKIEKNLSSYINYIKTIFKQYSTLSSIDNNKIIAFIEQLMNHYEIISLTSLNEKDLDVLRTNLHAIVTS